MLCWHPIQPKKLYKTDSFDKSILAPTLIKLTETFSTEIFEN